MKNTQKIATVTAVLTFSLIVLGGVVRITGSGMGCGDNWPLCNGHIFPPLDDVATVIEWGHRLVAALVSFLVVATAVVASVETRAAGRWHRSSPFKSASLAIILLAVQVFLGALTVWWELPPATIILHLAFAMGLLSALMVTAFRASETPASSEPVDPKVLRAVIVTAGIAGLTVLLGGLTANLNAGFACQGFPLCNGQIWPTSGQGGLAHMHWMHRLLAYGLLAHALGLAFRMKKRGASEAIRKWTWTLFGAVFSQVVIAAVMVLGALPPVWRSAHVAAGTAVWVCAVALWWHAAKGRAS